MKRVLHVELSRYGERRRPPENAVVVTEFPHSQPPETLRDPLDGFTGVYQRTTKPDVRPAKYVRIAGS